MSHDLSGRSAVVTGGATLVGQGVVQTGRWVYPVSKAALVQLTRSMAMDGRVGYPVEVGRVVAFLVSDAASVVTGADWAADGGYPAMGPEQAVPAIPQLSA